MQIDNSKIDRFIKLQELSPQDLLFPENFESVKYKAYSFLESYDSNGAMYFAQSLERLLDGLGSNDEQERYVYKIFTYWVLRLRVFSFRRLKEQEKIKLFKEQTLKIISLGLDLKNAVKQYLEGLYSESVVEKIVRNFKVALEDNSKFFGLNFTKSKVGDNFKPTVANWLKEYQSVLKPSGGMKLEPGSFHIVKFMNTNPYVKFLTEDEKQILRDLLDLYNWLLSPIVYADSREPAKQVIQTMQNVPYMVSQKMRMEENGGLKEEIKMKQPLLPPKVPIKPPVPIKKQILPEPIFPKAPLVEPRPKELSFIKKDQIPAVLTQKDKLAPKANEKPKPQEFTEFTSINIQDILNRRQRQADGHSGLKLGNGRQEIRDKKYEIGDRSQVASSKNQVSSTGGQEANRIIASANNNKSEKPRVDIDKKLEELKKKVGK